MAENEKHATAGLIALIALQTVMLGSLLTSTAPHPPLSTPIFGMGPFLGASLACAGAAIYLGPALSGAGRILAGLAAFAALVSFGPQKYFDAQFPLTWPAVISGQIAVATIAAAIFRETANERLNEAQKTG